jgi:hypothetical protein
MYVVGSLWHSENAYWGLKCVVCTDTKIITNSHNWNINCTENIQLRDIRHKKSMLSMHFANQYDETCWGGQMDLAHAVAPLYYNNAKSYKLHQEIQPKHWGSSAGWFTVFVFSARSKQGYEQMFWEGPQFEGGGADLNFAFPKYETGADFWNFHLPRLILGGGFGVKFHIPTTANQSISTCALYSKFEKKKSQNYQFGSTKWF